MYLSSPVPDLFFYEILKLRSQVISLVSGKGALGSGGRITGIYSFMQNVRKFEVALIIKFKGWNLELFTAIPICRKRLNLFTARNASF